MAMIWRTPMRKHHGDGKAHCFRKLSDIGFESLCTRYWRKNSGGRKRDRPIVSERCVECDRLSTAKDTHIEYEESR